MKLNERIKQIRIRHGYSMSEFAKLIGCSKSAIGMYETGQRKPKYEILESIADTFNVDMNYLLGKSDTERLENFTLPSQFSNIFPIEKKKISLLGDIACGKPIYADEDHESYVLAGTNVNADFCLRAKGDSMIGARILDGDVVFIQKADIVNNGEIAAVIIEDEATLKRVYYYPESQKLVLNAENPKYEPLVYVDSELEQIHILGKAVAFQSDVR